MKFGVKLPHSGSLASPEAIQRIALKAEELAFDSVWVHDHISYGRDWIGHRASGLVEITKDYEPRFYESIVTLSHVAGFTKKIRLGTSILVIPLRNPLVLGRQVITLQDLSGGRFVLGVGVGDYPGDFKAITVPYEKRGRITDEYLEVLRKVFQGGRISYNGEHVTVDDAHIHHMITPPPIFIGGGVIAMPEPSPDRLNPIVLRRAARFGDGWMPDWGRPEVIREGVRMLHDLAREYNREQVPFEVSMDKRFYIGHSDEEAYEKTKKTLAMAERTANVVAGIGYRSPRRIYENSLVGSAASIIEKIRRLSDVGVGRIIVTCLAADLNSFGEMLTRFDKDIAPAFK